MNLLVLTHELPYPPNDGGRIRTYNLLKQQSKDHAVTLVSFLSAGQSIELAESLRDVCGQVFAVDLPKIRRRPVVQKLGSLLSRYPSALDLYRSREMRALLRQVMAGEQLDVAHVDHLYLAQYVPDLGEMPVVLNHNDVECIGQARMRRRQLKHQPWSTLLRWPEHRRWCMYEIDSVARCDVSIAVSESDADYFRKRVPGSKVMVVPNGVDSSYFVPQPHRPFSCKVLFTGKMSYRPNVDAARWFCQKILPIIRESRPEVEFLVVGRDPAPEVRELAKVHGVTVTGTVKDVRPYFAQATLFVVPVRLGSGTRLKIAEAMAVGLPVVSTSLGCEGHGLTANEDILIADDAVDFARRVLDLLGDSDLRDQLGRRGRRMAESRFDWTVSAAHLSEAYEVARARKGKGLAGRGAFGARGLG